MEKKEFKDIFSTMLEKSNLRLTDKQLNNFYNYMIGVLDWNTKINLTAITEEKMFIVKHFLDSLTINKYLKNAKSLIDIGTGAGFPGIPLKIVNEDMKVTLIDSVNKKLNVIRDLSEKIQLENLEIIHTRAEELAQNKEYREKYDVATTRAVSNLSTIAEYMLPFVNLNGLAICMKGPNFKEELEESKKAIEILGGKLEEVDSINVGEELERNIIIIRKIKKTSKQYPRGQSKPLKEPLR